MQLTERESTRNPATIVIPKQHRAAAYIKVIDKRKRPIRGLWERNGRYYAQITVEDQVTGIKQVKRVPMDGVSTDAQAVAKLQELLTQRRKGALPVLKRTPRRLRAAIFRLLPAGQRRQAGQYALHRTAHHQPLDRTPRPRPGRPHHAGAGQQLHCQTPGGGTLRSHGQSGSHLFSQRDEAGGR